MKRILSAFFGLAALLALVVASGPKTGMSPTMTRDTGLSNDFSDRMGGVDLDETPPAAPAGLTADGANDLVTLEWGANSEGDLASYNVYRDVTTGSLVLHVTGVATGPVPTWTDTFVTNDSTYYYSVTAVDASANESAESSEVNVMPTAAAFAWTQFEIEPQGSAAADTIADGTIILDIGLATNNTASVRAGFRRHDGTYAAWSDTVPAVDWRGPPATSFYPIRFESGIPVANTNADSGGIDLAWSDATGEDHYHLQMQLLAGNGVVPVGWADVDTTIAADDTTYTHDQGTPGNTLIEPRRGRLQYRLYGALDHAGDDSLSAVALIDSFFYNQAVGIYVTGYAIEDTSSATTPISTGEMTDSPFVFISRQPPDVTAPDSTNMIAVVFDTTNVNNVRLDLGVVADESALAWWQWKSDYDGVWTPTSPEWYSSVSHDSTFSTWLTDSIMTTFSTADLVARDSVYTRVKLKDSAQNVSSWLWASMSQDSVVFARADIDTSAPDTTGVFVDVAFDTTVTADVQLLVHLDAAQSDEALFGRTQWKAFYNGTWAPADSTGEWKPATVATDSFLSWMATSTSTLNLTGDTLYVRSRLRDDESTPNISPWVDITTPISLVFARASAGEDTVGYGTIATDNSREVATNDNYAGKIVMPQAADVTKGAWYISSADGGYNIKMGLYDTSDNLVASGTASVGGTGWHEVTFGTPYSASNGQELFLMLSVDNGTVASATIYFDDEENTPTVIGEYDNIAYGSFPEDPLTSPTTYTNRRFSAYVTFE